MLNTNSLYIQIDIKLYHSIYDDPWRVLFSLDTAWLNYRHHAIPISRDYLISIDTNRYATRKLMEKGKFKRIWYVYLL